MKKILILIGLFICTSLYAEPSMRRCMLLPISDSVEGKIAFPVFQQLEDYLKDSEWCYYRHNSDIIDILGNYKRNITNYLQNKEVLKLIAEKTNSGTLIRVDIINQVEGVDLIVEVFGANGEDLYFKEKTKLDSAEPALIAQTINNWLRVYEKMIPYDGRVIGALGAQVTIDVGRNYGVRVGDEFKILRPLRKRRHPLLKEVVDWETTVLARGKVVSVTNEQAQGKIEEYNSRQAIKLEDWIGMSKPISTLEVMKDEEEDGDKYKFGKLGVVGLFFDLGTGSSTQSHNDEDQAKIGGMLVGIYSKLELWFTRQYWVGLDIGKHYGNYSKEKGDISSDTNVVDTMTYKLKAGHKYLPLGFFYGPQVDSYFGYASYNYGLDTDRESGLTETTYRGLMLGVRADMPVYNNYRAFIKIEVIPFGGFEEEVKLHNDDKSVFGYDFELGALYSVNPSMSFYGSLDFVSHKVKFEDDASHGLSAIDHRENLVRVGTQFTF